MRCRQFYDLCKSGTVDHNQSVLVAEPGADADGGSCSDRDQDSDAYGYQDADTDTDQNSNSHSYPNANTGAYGDSGPDTDNKSECGALFQSQVAGDYG